ncbi:MAG: protein kinase [Acidobacteria bacterium]|nr:protein kinase [Acidobacteriota bacterium]
MSQAIGHYDILGVVGTGGLGTVYRARDTRIGRTVAVRVLGDVTPDPLHRTRFIDSIRPYTTLSHSNIATLFDVGEHEGHVYLVYEFVSGEKLSALGSGHALNIRRALDLALQLADALAEAHACQLIHGALTPTAVFVTPKGHAKVLDFGLTAWERDSGDTRQTSARLAERGSALGIGAVGYMSPEQVLGQAIDDRTDIFALGAIIHEMLTGREPFGGSNASDIGLNVVQSTPTTPSMINPAVPIALDAIVARALAKNPADRYQSVAAMAAELRAASDTVRAHDASIDRPVPARQAGARWVRTGLLSLLLVAASALAAWHWQDVLRQTWHRNIGPRPTPLVVVLPFTIGGGEATRPYFGPGLAEDLVMRLGQMTGVTTLGRLSIRAFAGRSPQSVAQDVQASVALAGMVTPADPDWKKLNVRLSLVDRADGQTIWNRDYTAQAADIIALETRIARDVSERLGIPFKQSAATSRAALRIVDPAAFDAYLQARDAMAAQDASRAVQLFESAIAADSSMLEAQTGLVEALSIGAAFEGRLAFADVSRRMREAAEQAATADPDAAPVQLALGLSSPTLREALIRLRGAIEIDRSYVAAYWAIAELLRDVDPAKSMRFTRRVIELDPVSPLARYQLATGYIALGEFDQAMVETARGQALAPSLPWWDTLRARVRIVRPLGGDATAPRSERRDADLPPAALMLASSLMLDRRTADAATALTGITRLYPAACDAWAMLAGIHMVGADRAEGLRLEQQIVTQADKADDQAPWARCAAMTAAAVGDAVRAATWIARAAASDRVLRMWGATNGVMSPRAAIQQRLFPWRNVTANPGVISSVAALEASYARARGEATRILEGLLEQSPAR